MRYSVQLGEDVYGNIIRIDNELESFETKIKASKEKLEELHMQLETAKTEVQKPFAFETELRQKK